jgi:hypothetical protein
MNVAGFGVLTLDANSKSRGSAVGIATSYWLDDGEVGVRVPEVKNFNFCVSSRPPLGPTHPAGSFLGGKAAGA